MTHLLVFSHRRWDDVYQRAQHLMSRLARHYHVVFVEEPVPGAGPARLDVLSRLAGLDVLRPRTPVAAPGFHDDQLAVLRPLLAEYLRRQRIDDYLAWFCTPLPLPLIAGLRPRMVVYDCVDALSASRKAPPQWRRRESVLLRIAALVFTGGPSLYEAKRRLNPHVHCLPSAVDAPHFSPAGLADGRLAARAARLLGPVGAPRFGFCGVIDERLNVDLLERVARRRPKWHFVMVGPVARIDPATLPRRDNIHWLGRQSYACLPYLMASWDACLIPFVRDETTRFVNPTKTLEYLAAEKPVISTSIDDVIAIHSDVVLVADGIEAFIAACEKALHGGRDRDGRLAAMRSAVSRFSWDACAHVVHRLIANELAQSQAAHDALRGSRTVLRALVAVSEGARPAHALPACAGAFAV